LLCDLLRRLFAHLNVLLRREEIEAGFEVRCRTITRAAITIRAGLIPEH
jgi:hypothetical protein